RSVGDQDRVPRGVAVADHRHPAVVGGADLVAGGPIEVESEVRGALLAVEGPLVAEVGGDHRIAGLLEVVEEGARAERRIPDLLERRLVGLDPFPGRSWDLDEAGGHGELPLGKFGREDLQRGPDGRGPRCHPALELARLLLDRKAHQRLGVVPDPVEAQRPCSHRALRKRVPGVPHHQEDRIARLHRRGNELQRGVGPDRTEEDEAQQGEGRGTGHRSLDIAFRGPGGQPREISPPGTCVRSVRRGVPAPSAEHRMSFRTVSLAVLSVAALALAERRGTPAQPPRPASGRTEPDQARPLAWLLHAQNAEGGWGQEVGSPPDVATTSLSGLPLLRLGHTAVKGESRAASPRALGYVVRAVERAPGPTQYLQDEGTQPQRKLGRGIDTFLAAQFLGEAVRTLPAGEERRRATAALDLCVAKIQALQGDDGSFAKDGWAPAPSSAFAATGLYAARDVGAKVAPKPLARSEAYMMKGYDAEKKQFRTDDAAGVALYQAAGSLMGAAQTGKMAEAPARAARVALADEAFVRGFGSYGGEE